MKIDTSNCPFHLSSKFIKILEDEIQRAGNSGNDHVTLNFRDPTYSAEDGGYHPVEIRIDASGVIQYVTDFSYAGIGPYAELVKEIDFDFGLGLFQHFGREFALQKGKELFAIWCNNFVSYYRMEIFEVKRSFD